MPELTRRRYSEYRDECWHIYYGDVHAGTIAIRAGVPGWTCGFYRRPITAGMSKGTADTFEQARAEFEAIWRDYLPECTEADFEEYRCQQAWDRLEVRSRRAPRAVLQMDQFWRISS